MSLRGYTNTVQSLSNGYRIFGVSGFWGFEIRALKGVIHGTTIHGIVGRMRQTIEMTKREMEVIENDYGTTRWSFS